MIVSSFDPWIGVNLGFELLVVLCFAFSGPTVYFLSIFGLLQLALGTVFWFWEFFAFDAEWRVCWKVV